MNYQDLFAHEPMRKLASYLTTYNMATQAIALDANANDIQSTGGAACFINGVFIPALAADAALDISGDAVSTQWAAGTEYSVGDKRVYKDVPYYCIKAHTSQRDLPPKVGDYWTLWPDAVGVSIADGYDQYFMVTAKADGTLGVWKAGAAAATGEAVLTIPDYDARYYCPVAIMKVVNDSGDAIVIGTTVLTGDATFYQLLGPVFPAITKVGDAA